MIEYVDDDDEFELSLSFIEQLKAKGWTEADIARSTGRTRQAVNWHVQTYGGRMTPRQEVNKHFPFEVSSLQTQASPYRRLRDHGEFRYTNGKGMSEDKLKRLRAFYRKLRDEDVVLEFDPAIPPIPGVSNKGGWAFRQRLASDGDLLIRVNAHTNLTEEGRRIWRFPPVEP